MTEKAKEANDNENTFKEEKNLLEWAIFTVSLFLVMTILGYLGYKTYSDESIPPNLQVEPLQSPTETAPYRYQIKIKNVGGETAENVLIELVQKDQSVVVDKAEIQIPFVPQSSTREGWINFSKDPALADTVTARVVSFIKP